MKNNKILLSTFSSAIAAALLLPTVTNAAPLVSIGDNVDIFFNGSTSLQWTSNVLRDEDDELDDVIWTFSPGFEINLGRGLSKADFSIITRYDIVRYSDLDQLDAELFHIKAVGSYKSSRLDLSASASFDEVKSTTGDVNVTNDLIEWDDTAARIDGEYRFSEKLSVGSGVRYSEREYQTYDNFLADRETITIPVDIYYELTPKVDLSLGYSYSDTDVGDTNAPRSGIVPLVPGPGFGIGTIGTTSVSGYSYDSHFFNVGARGNLLPKLTGFFKVGYRVRDTDDSTVQLLDLSGGDVGLPSSTNRKSTGMLGLDANFTWAATPKITARLDLSRDFGVGGEGGTTENSTVNAVVSYSISGNWSAQANAGYTLREYDDGGREDHQYRLGTALTFVPNQNWRFSGGYNYTENDTDAFNRSYESHTLSLTATLRY
ncbi:MAG TPA: hypothetical protein DCX06_03750 [Opitutae bacterium]|nr:hypothetical protein [Opitutae bacterium]